MRILVIGAHPDDEILGCGGTISKHISNGDIVDVCIVTSATSDKWTDEYRQNKIQEAKNVDKALNISNRYYCNLETMTLKSLTSSKINDSIYKVINASKPDIIYTHYYNDINDDHREIFNSVMVCTRPINKMIIVRCFETLSSTEWGLQGFIPNYYVCLTSNDITKKINAFSNYASEIKDYPHPRSFKGIKNLAMKRGNEICVEFAEAYMTIRNFWE